MRISDWSSDVCSSDLDAVARLADRQLGEPVDVDTVEKFRRVGARSEERRVGKSVSVRVDLGGRRIIKKKKKKINQNHSDTELLQDTSIKDNYTPNRILIVKSS